MHPEEWSYMQQSGMIEPDDPDEMFGPFFCAICGDEEVDDDGELCDRCADDYAIGAADDD